MDLNKLPRDPLEARVLLLTEGARERTSAAANHIKNSFRDRAKFQRCLDFVQYDILDCMRSDWEPLARVWVFPATEAEDELSEGLNCLLGCAYKASRDNMRRALELIVVGVYFGTAHVSANEAREWLNSTRKTPFFSKTVDELAQMPRFDLLNAGCNWANELKDFNWGLSDTIHTRGTNHSLRELQPSTFHINSLWLPHFSPVHLEQGLLLWIETIEHLCVLLAAYNPVLLVGLPLAQKFGPDGPLSGFFEEGQTELLWELIPDRYHSVFRKISHEDDEVLTLRQAIEDLPDWEPPCS